METVRFSYEFGPDSVDDGDKTIYHSTQLSDDVLPLGEVMEAFEKFISLAYGYKVSITYDTRSDVSKQAEE